MPPFLTNAGKSLTQRQSQIPYFTEALLSNQNVLNINLKAIVLGDPTLGNPAAMISVVTTTYLHQLAPLYKIPLEILSAFTASDQACGFQKIMDLLTYPPVSKIHIPGNPEGLNSLLKRSKPKPKPKHRKRTGNGKRQTPCFEDIPDTPSLINASINAPCSIGCATYTTAFAYLSTLNPCFNPYNILASCDSPRDSDITGPTYWLNQPSVRKAIHAPPKRIENCNETVFNTLSEEEVEPAAYRVLPKILEKGVKVHVYSGDLD
ncbi:MAG: hypothetical protein Q9226_006014, partial [Calogaya cf. arnoldii]